MKIRFRITKKWIRRIAILVAVFGILSLLGVGSLYHRPLTAKHLKMLSYLNLPIVKYRSGMIKASEVGKRVELATKYSSNSDKISAEEIAKRILNERLMRNIASKLEITISEEELEKAVDDYERQMGMDGSNFDELLFKQYSLTQSDLKQLLIRPYLEDVKLRIWYAGRPELNNSAYKTVDLVGEALDRGENFGTLARKYSQDDSSKSTLGDTGDLKLDTLLPEIATVLEAEESNSKPVKIVSRFGVHFVSVLATHKRGGVTYVQLRQIFISCPGYEDWITGKIKAEKSYWLLWGN